MSGNIHIIQQMEDFVNILFEKNGNFLKNCISVKNKDKQTWKNTYYKLQRGWKNGKGNKQTDDSSEARRKQIIRLGVLRFEKRDQGAKRRAEGYALRGKSNTFRNGDQKGETEKKEQSRQIFALGVDLLARCRARLRRIVFYLRGVVRNSKVFSLS